MNNPILELRDIYRTYRQGGKELPVLRGANLVLAAGDQIALMGPSGAGKSTLLHIAGLLETADGGGVFINGKPAGNLSDEARTALRLQMIGFVYQAHYLLPEFSALENVILPQMIAGMARAQAQKWAMELLERVGLKERLHHRPAQLSGGEQQRVAIARALANKPKILIADEPTGNLDPTTAESVFTILRTMGMGENLAVLMATHNHDLARRMQSVLALKDGILQKAN